MNERIRELAEQAGLNAPYGSDHEGLRDFDYKKFAELIVRECASIARQTNLEKAGRSYMVHKVIKEKMSL